MNPASPKSELLEILHTSCPGVEFENETALIDNEILDSMDVVTIVSEIAGTFNVEIGVEDLVPENFNSIEAMMNLIQRRLN
ncbi:MAG: phosphopantetheine-binding protein [Defluviitaleaceae bacterium]|nr:phosphopantetheine-binding protein [Defluviitaleaceae bacterium]